MNKKAVSIILMLFEITVVIIVVGMALMIATNLGRSESLQKINAADDIAMMVNVLVGMPGDVLVEYPHNMSIYLLSLTSQAIIIYEGDRSKDIDPATRMFILPNKDYAAVGFVDKKAKVCLQKEGKTITIKECPTL